MNHIFTAMIFLFSLHATAADTPIESLATTFKSVGIEFTEADKTKVIKNYKRSGETHQYRSIIAELDKKRIEIEISMPYSEAEANPIIEMQYHLMQKLYQSRPTPYAGEISRSVDCKDEKLPHRTQISFLGEKSELDMAPANQRFVYGICDPKASFYLAGLIAKYIASSKVVFQLRVFVPINSGPAFSAQSSLEDLVSDFKKL